MSETDANPPVYSKNDQLEMSRFKRIVTRRNADQIVLDPPKKIKNLNLYEVNMVDPYQGVTVMNSFYFEDEQAALEAQAYASAL